MPQVEHIESLKAKHAALEVALRDEHTRPHPNDVQITELKRRKLRIKDEIERLASS